MSQPNVTVNPDGRVVVPGITYYQPSTSVSGPTDPNDPTLATTDQIDAHVNSGTPHPVYDNGPSLVLLYQNAKV